MSNDCITASEINGEFYGEMWLYKSEAGTFIYYYKLHCRTSCGFKTFENAVRLMKIIYPWCDVLKFNSAEEYRSVFNSALKKEPADSLNF